MGEEKVKIMERPEDDDTCDARHAYNEDGVDLTLIDWFLEKTPAERLRYVQNHVRDVLKIRALNAGR
jgi:hypothetical protein